LKAGIFVPAFVIMNTSQHSDLFFQLFLTDSLLKFKFFIMPQQFFYEKTNCQKMLGGWWLS